MESAVTDDQVEQWLVLIFGSALSIGLAPKTMPSRFRVGGAEYESLDTNYLTAFFDRLVDPAERLVGMRVSPVADSAQELMQRLPTAPYLTISNGGFDVWFSEAPIHDAVNRGDQAFGGQVFRTQSGSFAMSFDANYLCATPADYSALREANARWVVIEY
jgi:hypothetical protein